MTTTSKSLLDTAIDYERAKREARRRIDAEERPPQKLQCVSIPELFKLPTVDYLVDQLLPQQALAELIGDSESLKSFFAIHLGLAIATNQDKFFGQRIVKNGPVIYVCAEGAGSFQYRVRAWATEHSVDLSDMPFHTVPVPVNLRDPAFQLEFRALATKLNPVLIVVDTLHRCTPGAEENTSRDIGEVVAFAQTLQYEHHVTVLFLHHPPKNDPSGRGRGSSTLYYAADTEISAVVDGEENPDGTKIVNFTVKKQKDDQKISFSLTNHIVDVLNDQGQVMRYAADRPIRTCVLVEATEQEKEKATGTQGRADRILKYVKNNPSCTKSGVTTFVGGDKRVALQDIEDLVEKGLLIRTVKGNSHLLTVGMGPGALNGI